MEKRRSQGKSKAVKQLQEKPGKTEFLIVGIGASAGGIQALQEFFQQVKPDFNMAYVVILHLSPDHDSQLAAILQKETSLPVQQVTEKTRIATNHIYVIPPNQHLTIEDGFLAVSLNMLVEDRRAPVDIFFRTLADEHGPRAVAVILSGSGANGSMGLKRIKERGGACFVQNPREAEFNEMPRNSIATGMVDDILPVAAIPAKILAYRNNFDAIEIAPEADTRPEEQQVALRDIFTQLRVRTGHDFSNYKRPTLLRRIERRISIHGLSDLPSYAKYLHDHPEEAAALLQDFLISVTNFFRDKKPFDVLETDILPALFKGKNSENQVRIWVAGCATGEEAYSMAMLCAEKTLGAIDAPKVQIFATDIDESAIARARDGLYSLNDAADVSPERLRRYFNKEGDAYRVRREIREMIMFAHHNFLKDPPFSHLDLISCRNVMIYLNHVAQERVVETFHFALNPGGYLFLGSSESVDGASDLYAVVNREQHIFQSRQVAPRSYPIPDSTPSLYFEKFKKDAEYQAQEKKILERISFGDLHQQLLEEYAPPSLVINEEYDILHLTERAGRYLQVGGGELSQNLLKLIKPEIRLDLRSALYQAVQRQSPVEARGLKLKLDDSTETINVHVRPVLRPADTAKGFLLVVFEPATGDGNQEILLASDEPLARQLEEELIRLKAQLRASSEQHDFQAEEMKASNEELQAMNEELRSAAEELETSKEELQSINEELRTVNQELKVKIEETSIASNNLHNLVSSTDIGTIFLDRSLRVALYTPAATDIFNLIPADFGRPLSDITTRLEQNDIFTDAETVLSKLNPIQKNVRTKDGKFFLMRITPYRTDDDRIKGVVITFVDITASKKTDEDFRLSEQRLVLATQAGKTGTFIYHAEDDRLDPDPQMLALFGLSGNATFNLNEALEYIVHKDDRNSYGRKVMAALDPSGDGKLEADFRIVHPDGSAHWINVSAQTYFEGTPPRAVNMPGVAIDITERKKMEEALRLSEERLRITMESAVDYAIVATNEMGIVTGWSRGAEKIFGYEPGEIIGQSADILFTPEDRSNNVPNKEMETARREGRAADERWHIRKDESRFYASGVLSPILDGGLSGYVKIARDMTKQKEAEEQLKLFEERNRVALQSAEMAAWDWNIKNDTIVWNEQHYLLFGLEPADRLNNADFFLQYVVPDDREDIAQKLKDAVDNTGIYKAEFRIKRADNNEIRWMSGFGRAIEWDGRQAARMVGVMYEITERKKLEQQKEDFLNIASHELKTPVTSIKAYGEILQETFEERADKDSMVMIQKMNAQVSRLNSLISDLLDTTKIAEGQLSLIYESFDICGLIRQLVEEFQQVTKQHIISVACEKEVMVYADKKRIEQVITNLLSNAIKYSPDGGAIEVSCEVPGEEVKVSVTDNGIGISPELQEKVFNRFFRVRNVAGNTFPGMGLGLYITAGIIQRHGGTIGLRSNPGKGSVFYFTLQRSN